MELEKEIVWLLCQVLCQVSVFTVSQVENTWLIFLSLPEKCQFLYAALEQDYCGQGNSIFYNMQVVLTRLACINHSVGSKCHYIIYVVECVARHNIMWRCKITKVGTLYSWNFPFHKNLIVFWYWWIVIFFLSNIQEFLKYIIKAHFESSKDSSLYHCENSLQLEFLIWVHY